MVIGRDGMEDCAMKRLFLRCISILKTKKTNLGDNRFHYKTGDRAAQLEQQGESEKF
jgi:hypothetical protein